MLEICYRYSQYAQSKVITNLDPQVFVPMNSFNLTVVHMNLEIEIVAVGNEHVLNLVTCLEKGGFEGSTGK